MNIIATPVIQMDNVYKVYRGRRGRRMALDGIQLTVEPGQVHGFLGPNGSGKTTTLRALLGLVRADAGTMRLFGHDVPAALPNVINAIGAVVESPQFFGEFTARRTLRLLATVGGLKRARVEEALEVVGLRDRARERVKTFSLGMKQRLAVAAALLKSPSLLILDEPANGLDPAGIREMRDLLRALREQGVTVLLSSHILSEVQQICDHVTIVSRGRRVTSGPVEDVLSKFDKGDVRVKVNDLDAAAKLIAGAGLPVQVFTDHMIVSDLADPGWITETLAKRRMYVSELTPLLPDLENVFLDLTGTAPTLDGLRQIDDAYQPPSATTLDILKTERELAEAAEDRAPAPRTGRRTDRKTRSLTEPATGGRPQPPGGPVTDPHPPTTAPQLDAARTPQPVVPTGPAEPSDTEPATEPVTDPHPPATTTQPVSAPQRVAPSDPHPPTGRGDAGKRTVFHPSHSRASRSSTPPVTDSTKLPRAHPVTDPATPPAPRLATDPHPPTGGGWERVTERENRPDPAPEGEETSS